MISYTKIHDIQTSISTQPCHYLLESLNVLMTI